MGKGVGDNLSKIKPLFRPRTVIIYDDNRVDLQGALTRQLDDMI
jgi:hypothetical protein